MNGLKLFISLIIFSVFLVSCSALPTKEFELAKTELDKAKNNQAPELAQKEYQEAEGAYKSAESFMKEKEGDKAKEQSVKTLEKSRIAILLAKDIRAEEQIKKVDALLQDIKGLKIKDLDVNQDIIAETEGKLDLVKKLKPAEDLLKDAKKDYQSGKGLVPAVQQAIQKAEALPEVDQFINAMNQAYEKALEAEKLIQNEVEAFKAAAIQAEADKAAALAKLRSEQELKSALYTKVTKGNELEELLEKDSFVNEFYKEEKDKVLEAFRAFRKMVQDNQLEEAKNALKSVDDLQAFYDKMKNEKILLGGKQAELSNKMLSKMKGFYQKEAESYLEKAKRLKEEVERLYGPQSMKNKKENSVSFIGMKTFIVSQEAGINEGASETEKKVSENEEKPANPEGIMLKKLDGLYQDAESSFEKEEYSDSIEKAKEAIELAEKMIALKKKLEEDKNKNNTTKTVDNTEKASFTIVFKTYKVKSKDCLWMIAMRKEFYRNAALWPFIWYANKDRVKDPNMILPGTVLKVPLFKNAE
ncbi:MAG: hypothetical protein A2Y41_06290 [Spirochaetes bacterium GWB1_36_13]|nr:MAG: hypothetical protein A2Y41_06290 [Spirochaetes bacterium GWB1_36_13]